MLVRGVLGCGIVVVGSIGLFRKLEVAATRTETREIAVAARRGPEEQRGAHELTPASRLDFITLDDNDRRLEKLSLRAEALERPTLLEWTFRTSDQGSYRLDLRFAETLEAGLHSIAKSGEATLLSTGTCGATADGRFEIALHCDDSRLAVFAEDRRLVAAVHDGPRRGGISLRAVNGKIRLDRFCAAGLDPTGAPFEIVGPDVAIETYSWDSASTVVLLLLAVGCGFYFLGAGATSVRLSSKAAVVGLSVGLLPIVAELFGAPDAPLVIDLLFAIAGTVTGRIAMRNPTAPGALSSKPSIPIRSRLVASALALALAVFAVDRATRIAVDSTARDRFLVAEETASTETFRSGEARVLDASNAFEIPGPYGSTTVRGRATLEPDGVLEVRLRAATKRAAGIAWIASTRESLGNSFVREETTRSCAIGKTGPAVPAGREFEFEIVADGFAFEARVNGSVVARTEDSRFAAGPIVFLAASKAATLRDLEVTPAAMAVPPEFTRNGLDTACWFLAIVTVLLTFVCRYPLENALGLAAIALAPCAVLRSAPPLYPAVLLVAFVVFLILLIATQSRGKAIGIVRAHLALLAALVLAPASAIGLGLVAPLASETQEIGDVRLVRDLVHFQHPAVRQLNDYLVRHRFRGREHALAQESGTSRIVCLGASSTWGFGFEDGSGFDYPTILERRLNSEGRKVEVQNAAYPGTHAHSLYHVLAEQLRDYSFDVLTLSLTYNDSYLATQFDAHAELDRLIDLPAWQRVLVNARAKSGILGTRTELQRLIASFDRENISTTNAWRTLGHLEDPPAPVARFEAALRRIAEITRARGARLVLMKEPLRGDRRMIWKDEFRAAIDRVAADHGGFVADPTPALLAFRGERLFMDDVHPTAVGNEVIAEVLAKVVSRALETR